jgi:hypothetical protein
MSSILSLGNPSEFANSSLFDVEMYDEIISSESFLYNLANTKIPTFINAQDSIFIGDIVLSLIRNKKSITDNLLNKKKKEKLPQWETLKHKTGYNPKTDLFVYETPILIVYDPIVLSVIHYMKSNISVEKKDKFITVSSKMESPYHSAILSKVVLDNLVYILKKFKIQRQSNQIQYLELKVKEAQKNYFSTQKKLASNKDRSLGLIFESSNIPEQNLTNDNSIAFNIYNQAALQLEQSKSNLKMETPVFATLDQIQLPNVPYAPNLYKLFLYYLFAWLISSFIYILIKLIFKI